MRQTDSGQQRQTDADTQTANSVGASALGAKIGQRLGCDIPRYTKHIPNRRFAQKASYNSSP